MVALELLEGPVAGLAPAAEVFFTLQVVPQGEEELLLDSLSESIPRVFK